MACDAPARLGWGHCHWSDVERGRQDVGFDVGDAHLDARDAFERQQMALTGFDFPTSFRGLSAQRLAWLKRVEKEYYLPLLAHRAP